MKAVIAGWGYKLGIDRAIFFTLIARGIQALGGVVMIYFISNFLTRTEQGYYYTFTSLLAIQIFFELGFSSIIVQYVAHEFAHLSWGNRMQLEGEDKYKSRLSYLLRFCLKWYGIISMIFFIILVVTGFVFFSHYGSNEEQSISWKIPWLVICFSSAANLMLTPFLSYLEGLGKIAGVAKIRMVQQIAQVTLALTFFVFHCKLLAAPLAAVISFSTAAVMVFFSDNREVLWNIWREKVDEWRINYRKEILPYQAKVALSWISGYLIFQLFNPIMFATKGPVLAGQFGMSLTVLNGVLMLSLSWVSTKVPRYSVLIARKEFDALDRIFYRTTWQSLSICALGIIVFLLGVYVLGYWHHPIASRFLGLLPLVFLSACTLMNQYVNSLATYLRCHKQEPYVVQSVVMAIAIALYMLICSSFLQITYFTLGYFCLSALGFYWCIDIFKTKQKLWH